MSDAKSWGTTVLGWFVVRDGQPPQGEEAPPETPPPAEPAAPVAFEGGAPAAPGGRVDFDAVFDAAGIAAAERDLFTKAAGLLASLPEGTDAATRKTIVEASLKAFGIPIDRIIETGAHQVQTLEAYLQEQAAKTRSVAEESQKLIADYEAKIRDVRALLERRITEQGSVQTSCNGKKLEVQKVLEFFGQEAVARVVRESPKLVEPAAAPAPRKD